MEIYAFKTKRPSLHQTILCEAINHNFTFESLQVIFNPDIAELKEDDYNGFQMIELIDQFIRKSELIKNKKVTMLDKNGQRFKPNKEMELYKVDVSDAAPVFFIVGKEGEVAKVLKLPCYITYLTDLETFRKYVKLDDYSIINNTPSRAPHCPPQTGS